MNFRKFIIILIVFLVVLSVGYTYQKTVIEKDFEVISNEEIYE